MSFCSGWYGSVVKPCAAAKAISNLRHRGARRRRNLQGSVHESALPCTAQPRHYRCIAMTAESPNKAAPQPGPSALELAHRVEQFVRTSIVPYEKDPRWGSHGPSADLISEMRTLARSAGLLTPHIRPEGRTLTHRDAAPVLRAAGLSLLGPVALNVAAPDEGNMFLLG